MIIDAIDPGVKYLALARFDQARLDWTVLLESRTDFNLEHAALVVIERPCYQGMGRRVRPQDIIDLAWAARGYAARYPSYIDVTYGHWARGWPQKQLHSRIRKQLMPEELAILPKTKKELDHCLDAVGIGLDYFGRLW